MITFVLYLLLIGIVAGYLATMVPAPDRMSFSATVLLGIAGSFIGGVAGALLFSGRLAVAPGGILASIVGAVVALFIYRVTTAGRTRHSEHRSL
jgi:uncharacterized membrane protein YeaQ/YmgE (transglycosylase-associated protein family)